MPVIDLVAVKIANQLRVTVPYSMDNKLPFALPDMTKSHKSDSDPRKTALPVKK